LHNKNNGFASGKRNNFAEFMSRPNNKNNKQRFNKDIQPARSPRKRTTREFSNESKKGSEKGFRPALTSDKRTTKETSTGFKEFERKGSKPERSPRKRITNKPSTESKKNSEKGVRHARNSDKRIAKETSTGIKEFERKGSKPERSPRKRITNNPSTESKKNSEKGVRYTRNSDKRIAKETSTGLKEFDRKNSQPSRSPRKRIINNPSTESKKGDENRTKPAWSPRKRVPRRSSIELKKVDENETRLNKYLASTGLCSRREADDLIKTGLITVNGYLVTELGVKVRKGDDIRYNGERLKTERLVYILLNKPKDYITTVRDDHAKRTVMELVQKACKERVYPVGRLDKNTTGVLLLTNDGDLAKKLTHPSYNKLKIYHVTLDKSLSRTDFHQIIEGITLNDGFIKSDALSFIEPKSKKDVGIELHSGRNHIVRRIFEHFDYKVKKLDRVYFAGLTKKGLERGKYRFLNETEIAMLKMGSYK
jgi:23S rRNA pseudouridine2605 synthase